MKKGTLIVLSGFSGAGKGTVAKELVNQYGYSLSVSATTRTPREGEVHGREYFFKTEAEFLQMIDYNGFIEYAQYVEHYYGTPRKFVEDELNAGRTVILEIEVQGAMAIKEQYPDALLIFITAQSADELKSRLVGRGTETEEVIAKRLKRASEEAKSISQYEFLVVNENGKVAECAQKIDNIVKAVEQKATRQAEFVKELQDGFQYIS